MLTANERINRAFEICQDAFVGQPVMFEQIDGDPLSWEGAIHKDAVIYGIRLQTEAAGPLVFVRITVPNGEPFEFSAGTYEEMAEGLYTFARLNDLQEWVSPRHFTHLVNTTFKPQPPLAYNAMWPHDNELRLGNGLRLHFQWDELECRLVAALWAGDAMRGQKEFRSPDDAVGWLAFIRGQLQGSTSSSSA